MLNHRSQSVLITSTLTVAILWPLLAYVSNDDVNYIRDPEHLTTIYAASGRYVAAFTSWLIQLFRTEIVQLGFVLRLAAVVLAAISMHRLIDHLRPELDPWAKTLLATIPLIYPLSLDLFSFSITANVLIVHFICLLIYIEAVARAGNRFSIAAIAAVAVGLFNYQLIMMFAVIVATAFAMRVTSVWNHLSGFWSAARSKFCFVC